MNFSSALVTLANGFGVRLSRWSPEVTIRMQRPDDHSKMTAPYLYVESRFGKVPWLPTQIELMSNEWEVRPDSTPSEGL